MDNIEQLIDDAIIAAALHVAEHHAAEPVQIDGMTQLGLDEHHAVDDGPAEPMHQLPPGMSEIPYVAPGILTHVYKHDPQPSTWDIPPTTVVKASWRCKQPHQREWAEVLKHINGVVLHVCDNESYRVDASRTCTQTCIGTYDHTRTRDQIISHKRGTWVASPEPIGDATIRVLNFGKATAVTIVTDSVDIIGAATRKLKCGMSIVVQMRNDFSSFADICVSVRRCFECVYVYAGEYIYIVAHAYNKSPWHVGSVTSTHCHDFDEIVKKVLASRESARELIDKISATAIHGVVDADLLDRTWPSLE
jgi:hypothetical protein